MLIQILCPNWCSTHLRVFCSEFISHYAFQYFDNKTSYRQNLILFVASKYYIYILYVHNWIAYVQFVNMRDLTYLTMTMVSHFLLNYWFYVTEGPRRVTNSQGFDLLCLEQLVLRNVLVGMNRIHIVSNVA